MNDITEQSRHFERRMTDMDDIMRKEQLESYFAHSDMVKFIIDAYFITFSTATLCKEMEMNIDLSAYTRHHFSQWQSKIAGWQKRIREVPTFNIADKVISQRRSSRLTLINRIFRCGGIEAFMSGKIDDTSNDDYLAKNLTFGGMLNEFDKTLGVIEQFIDRLAHLPLNNDCTEALRRYVNNPSYSEAVNEERLKCQQFFAQRKNRTVGRLLLYIRMRLQAMMGERKKDYVSLSPNETEDYIRTFTSTYQSEALLFPKEADIPEGMRPLADRPLVAKMLYFLDMSDTSVFPKVDVSTMVEYLTLNNFRGCEEDEVHLCCLLALAEELQPIYASLTQGKVKVPPSTGDPVKDTVYRLLCQSNATLANFIVKGRTLDDLNAFFHHILFDADTDAQREAQQQLCKILFINDRLQLKYYLYLLHEASERHLFNRSDSQAIYDRLHASHFCTSKGTLPTVSTVKHYLAASSHNDEPQWKEIESVLMKR